MSINTEIQTAESIKPELVKTSIQLSPAAIERLKLTSAKHGRGMGQIIDELIMTKLPNLAIVEQSQAS